MQDRGLGPICLSSIADPSAMNDRGGRSLPISTATEEKAIRPHHSRCHSYPNIMNHLRESLLPLHPQASRFHAGNCSVVLYGVVSTLPSRAVNNSKTSLVNSLFSGPCKRSKLPRDCSTICMHLNYGRVAHDVQPTRKNGAQIIYHRYGIILLDESGLNLVDCCMVRLE